MRNPFHSKNKTSVETNDSSHFKSSPNNEAPLKNTSEDLVASDLEASSKNQEIESLEKGKEENLNPSIKEDSNLIKDPLENSSSKSEKELQEEKQEPKEQTEKEEKGSPNLSPHPADEKSLKKMDLKKEAKKQKKEADPTKPPKPNLSQKVGSWFKEAKKAQKAILEASSSQPNAYSFEKALQNHKPSLPTQPSQVSKTASLSVQSYMLKNPKKPLGFSQVLQVCMASVWIYLGLSFMLGIMMGVPLNLAPDLELYLTSYSLIFWSTTVATGTMAIAYGSTILKVNPFKALQNTHFDRHWIWKGFCMMVAANLILSIITTFFMNLFSTFVFPLAPSPDFDVTGMPFLAGALEFMVVCLIGPVFEEMLYRGLIYRNLSRFNKGFAVIFSALLFGLAHGNLGQAVPTFGVGLVLAYGYAKSDSLWVPILLHILNNTCLMIISTFPVLDVVVSIGLWIALIVGLWVFFQEYKEWRALFYQANQDKELWSFVARMPSFWLYVVAFLILSVI